MVRAGALRHLVQIERATESQDSQTNEVAETWIPVRKVWANIQPVGGSEQLKSKQIQGTETYVIETRFADDLNVKCRLKYRTKTFGIESVLDIDERRRMMRLACVERVNEPIST